MTTRSEVYTQKHVRFFIQPGGANPANAVLYSGKSNTYINIESTSRPVRGGISPINVHDPDQIGRYRQIGRTVDAPDFPTADVNFLQKKDSLPRHLTQLANCKQTFYQMVGDCADLSDFNNGWSGYIKVLSDGEVTEITEAGGSWDGDEQLQDDLSFTFSQVYNIGKLSFSEKASTTVTAQVVDIVWGSREQCDDCGPSDDGTKTIYAVLDNTAISPGDPPDIVYSVDSGVTWTIQSISVAGATDDPVAIGIVGKYLVVAFSLGTGGYFYTPINRVTGIPDSTGWTKITSGFVNSPSDMFVQNAGEVWFSGVGGYIYKSESITSGVSVVEAGDVTTQELTRIHGLDEIIVSASRDAVVYSTNRGETFAATDSFPLTGTPKSLWVVSDYVWWMGGDGGELFYTLDQGANWVDVSATFGTSYTAFDIIFPTPEVGFISVSTSGPVATIWATMNGGYTWTNTSPRLSNLPTFDNANRLATPEVSDANIAVNNLAVGGLAGDGSDGIILVAKTSVY